MRGSISVYRDHKGVRQWRGQWREDGHAKTKKLGPAKDISRAQARKALDEHLKALGIVAALAKTSPTSTLRDFIVNEYLMVKTRVWKRSTRETTESMILDHIVGPLGARPIASIGRRELQARLDEMADAGLSESVVHHVRSQMGAIFRMAMGDKLIIADPSAELVNPTCKAPPPKRVITVDEIRRGQMALKIRDRVVFRLAVHHGMRPGEIFALQVGDIQGEMIVISRGIYRGTIQTTKSRNSDRSVPLDDTAPILAAYIETLAEAGPTAWLFPSDIGKTPISGTNCFRRSIAPALAKVGLVANFQAMRRTWVTELGKVEQDVGIRAKLAGHAADVNENTYRQADEEQLKRTMRKLGEHLQ